MTTTESLHPSSKLEQLDLQESLLRACQDGQAPTMQRLLKQDLAAIYKVDELRLAEQLFVVCAEYGSLDCLRLLIRKFRNRLNIDAVDEDGTPCLHLSVLGQHVEMVEYLLKCGADVNTRDGEGHVALHWAVVCQHHDIMTLLLVNGADVDLQDNRGATTLHYAAHMCGKADISGQDTALLLLQHLLYVKASASCEDIDGRSPLLWAANTGSSTACKMLVAGGARVDQVDRNGLSALHCASTRGHSSVITTLVQDCNASVNLGDGRCCPALFYAISHCQLDCVQTLLCLGAHVDCRDVKGRSAAHYAAELGNLEIVKELLAAGCDFWLWSNGGELPVHAAIRRSKRDVAAFLLKQPTKINRATLTGCLHLAAGVNNTETIDELLHHGVDINVVAKYKKAYMTALDVAQNKGHHECCKYIKLNGGRHAKGLVNTSARRIQTAFRATKQEKKHSPTLDTEQPPLEENSFSSDLFILRSTDQLLLTDLPSSKDADNSHSSHEATDMIGDAHEYTSDISKNSSVELLCTTSTTDTLTDTNVSPEAELDEVTPARMAVEDTSAKSRSYEVQNEVSDSIAVSELTCSIKDPDEYCPAVDVTRSSDLVESSKSMNHQQYDVSGARMSNVNLDLTLSPADILPAKHEPETGTAELRNLIITQHTDELVKDEKHAEGDHMQSSVTDTEPRSKGPEPGGFVDASLSGRPEVEDSEQSMWISDSSEAYDQRAASQSSKGYASSVAPTSARDTESHSQNLLSSFTNKVESIAHETSSNNLLQVNKDSGIEAVPTLHGQRKGVELGQFVEANPSCRPGTEKIEQSMPVNGLSENNDHGAASQRNHSSSDRVSYIVHTRADDIESPIQSSPSGLSNEAELILHDKSDDHFEPVNEHILQDANFEATLTLLENIKRSEQGQSVSASPSCRPETDEIDQSMQVHQSTEVHGQRAKSPCNTDSSARASSFVHTSTDGMEPPSQSLPHGFSNEAESIANDKSSDHVERVDEHFPDDSDIDATLTLHTKGGEPGQVVDANPSFSHGAEEIELSMQVNESIEVTDQRVASQHNHSSSDGVSSLMRTRKYDIKSTIQSSPRGFSSEAESFLHDKSGDRLQEVDEHFLQDVKIKAILMLHESINESEQGQFVNANLSSRPGTDEIDLRMQVNWSTEVNCQRAASPRSTDSSDCVSSIVHTSEGDVESLRHSFPYEFSSDAEPIAHEKPSDHLEQVNDNFPDLDIDATLTMRDSNKGSEPGQLTEGKQSSNPGTEMIEQSMQVNGLPKVHDQRAASQSSSDSCDRPSIVACTRAIDTESPRQRSLPQKTSQEVGPIAPEKSSDHLEQVHAHFTEGPFTEVCIPTMHDGDATSHRHHIDRTATYGMHYEKEESGEHDTHGRSGSRSHDDELQQVLAAQADFRMLELSDRTEQTSWSQSMVSDEVSQLRYSAMGSAAMEPRHTADHVMPKPPPSSRMTTSAYRRPRPRTSSGSPSMLLSPSAEVEGQRAAQTACDLRESHPANSVMPESDGRTILHSTILHTCVYPPSSLRQSAPQRPKTASTTIQQTRLSTSLRVKKEVQSSVRQYETRRLMATTYREQLRLRHRAPIFSVITILPSMPSTLHYDSNVEFPAVVTHKDKTKKTRSMWQN